MAKKKRAKPNTEGWNMKPIIAQMRGSVEFKEWMEGAAKADRSSVAMFMERAVVFYAKSIGHTAPPPER
jgi:hypothetical protein